MKVIITGICFYMLVFVSVTGFSQHTFLSAGGEIAFPSSYGLNMVAGTLLGGSLRLESSWGRNVAGIVTIGYLASSPQTPYQGVPTTKSSYKAFPVQVGIKYYTKKKKEIRNGLFISGELGLIHTTTHFTYAANPDHTRKETDFGAATGVGYLIGKAEASFRLQYDLTDAGYNVYYYNLRLAYTFRRGLR